MPDFLNKNKEIAYQYMKPHEFYSVTLAECLNYVSACQKKEKRELQEKAVLAFRSGCIISSFVWKPFEKNKNDFEIADFFPELFEKKENNADWKIAKERFRICAEIHNERIRERREKSCQ